MSAFMIPVAEYFTVDDARECYFDPCQEDGGDPGDEPEAGWYSRLSAPGYLDATEWQGPYPNAFRAIRAVCELYEVDVHGEDRSGY